ncbi:tRNA (adenosine(37)-N6)-threonylcarbamoyltransferase complex dimerization subunit type 1 TsaB [Buchnera aphidicola (Hyadaphis tataricae)]|uniref:tRNA threonylcarbamoyladenosine biosynthesis protein TsaB n=1 Tax=Buchnera aphidicola (Hyadaphis tataricae) TaxID=1241859 RepID=A0A4D6YB03_9GAMM|nr:tRNA (adenosine(37)-N6)-threonylcarbamoyltransferase complex dimerization subunit type 1 TsaB [Buchnera aphidicola]QCI21625.1 tRNA (adenosine(37)-N6)-threonylcarbamoyltransferase complex dimerization subunit type 1 TsaB [Buchnera aphidicola (Hyadaphis tataricae)]
MSNTILTLDSSIDSCSFAIYKNHDIQVIQEYCKKKHTTKMLPMLQKILLQTNTKLHDLNYIAFAKGPGNFTSIRFAASIAQSLSLSLNIPIMSVSTLSIMAQQAWRKYQKKEIIILLNTQKKNVYWGQYIRNTESIWTGSKTETVIEKTKIQNKIQSLKKIWTVVSNPSKICCYARIPQIKNIKYFFPNAQDIIPFVLLKIQKKEHNFSINSNINYLDKKFNI